MRKIIFLAGVIFIAQFFYFGFYAKTNTDTNFNTVDIYIQAGDSLGTISQQLKDNNIINSKILFLYYAKKTQLDKKIQTGQFTIPLPQTIPSTLNIITTPPTISDNKVTVPEGYKIAQIDDLLARKNLTLPNEFINCLKTCKLEHPLQNPNYSFEGFLFPDTYFINTNNFHSEQLINKMTANFKTKLPANHEEQLKNLPVNSLYEAIIMASIIEREVLSQKDKQLVAGILWKRFRSGWLIDADAALLYEKNDNIITRADLDSHSPYNLRKIKGLPPTAISNPGFESIYASLNPIESDYWFYLTTLDTGKVIYAKTNDEHNMNKYKYLQKR